MGGDFYLKDQKGCIAPNIGGCMPGISPGSPRSRGGTSPALGCLTLCTARAAGSTPHPLVLGAEGLLSSTLWALMSPYFSCLQSLLPFRLLASAKQDTKTPRANQSNVLQQQTNEYSELFFPLSLGTMEV